MPELPEVQTIVNDLQKITGDHITGFVSYWPKAVKNLSVSEFRRHLSNRKIESMQRIGKSIVFGLDSGHWIFIHLKMTGQLLSDFPFPFSHFKSNPQFKVFKQDLRALRAINPHVHHLFFLKTHGTLAFSDVRKFATIELLDGQSFRKVLKRKGIDPLSRTFTHESFVLLINDNEKKNVKQLLMDQSILSGIGNIYASEILFHSKINPARKAYSLSAHEIAALHKSIGTTLNKAIALRGTSVSDYRDSSGKKGSFQNDLRVYKKHGQKCASCATIIEKTIIGQRSTFHCTNCQK